MSWATIVAAAVTVLVKHADFTTDNTKHGDNRVLAEGPARAASLSYGGVLTEEWTLKRLSHTWAINVDLLVPWPGDQATFEANLGTERQKVIDTYASWPKLDATAGVLSAILEIGQEVDLLTEGDGAYRGQRLILSVQEIVDPSRQE